MSVEQLPLFPGDSPRAVTLHPGLTSESSLRAAMERFRDHMIQQEYAENTVKSFLGDLRILKRYLNGDPPVGQISTKNLQDYLHWLQYERGKPCSPKSYARRLTTLKVFFAWLVDVGVLSSDPAAPLVHKPVQTPLPRILYDDQVDQVLAVTRQMMLGEPSGAKPDPRPHLLITLLLHTGIKKQECMGIKLAHIDTSNPDGSAVYIRYDSPRMHHKERRLSLPPGWTRTLIQYRQVYEPEEILFPCTARNLEYVLANVAKLAGLPDGLSFEMLRWTCAVRDYQARMDPDRLRRKLGLSQMSWQETEPKLVRLSEPPL
ncbi:MAG TPA: phage integrase N-terminal SAM-like domain-containing protein [Anaerolineae bacterium]|nr:phage integrase N-terminal SAM-like domain-containing protein [Anaerolineae bacterium]